MPQMSFLCSQLSGNFPATFSWNPTASGLLTPATHYSNLPPGSYSLWTCLPGPCPRAFVLAAVSGWNPLPLHGWCLTSLSSVAVRTGWDSTLSTQTLYTFSGQLGYLIKETHALKPARRSHHSNKGYLWMRVSISFTLNWPISPLSASDLTWVKEPSCYH